MVIMSGSFCFSFFFFFFNDTATTEIYTLSLHDALPISCPIRSADQPGWVAAPYGHGDRKSTRLNSSHDQISYAVFCLKKKKKKTRRTQSTRPLPQHARGAIR